MLECCDTLKLCAYMFATEKFNESEKLFESFCPLIETVLLEKKKSSMSFEVLHNELNSVYGIEMPRATLKALLEKLGKEGKVKLEKNIVNVQWEFLNGKYVREREAKEAEINEIFFGFRGYMFEKDICLEIDEIKQIICNFLFTHCYDLVEFFSVGEIPTRVEVQYALHLCDYIMQCKSTDLTLYQCFVKLYKGAVQTTLLNFQPTEIETLEKRSINVKKVILDSNFVMRILNIQASLECTIARETLHNVKKTGAEVFILKQTVEEITQSIKKFLSDISPYTQYTSDFFRNREIRFSGMYDALQRGMSRTEFFELTKYDDLVKKLSENFGIQIVEDYECSTFSEEDIESLIREKGKITYQREQAIHDLTLISYCASLRKNRNSDFVDAEVWVLTNDIKLTSWNRGKSKNIQNCILEAQMSNMMWLENPKDDNLGLVNTITTLASREMVDQGKFHKFLDRFQEKKKQDNPIMTHMMSVVFAADALCSEDINSIDNDDYDFEEVFRAKSEKIKEKQKEKEEQQRSKEKQGEIKLKITKWENEILKKEHEERDLREVIKNSDKLLDDIAELEKSNKCIGKKLKMAYWFAVLLIIVIIFRIVSIGKIISALVDLANSSVWNIIGVFADVFGSVIFCKIMHFLKFAPYKSIDALTRKYLERRFKRNASVCELIVEELDEKIKEKRREVEEKKRNANEGLKSIRAELQEQNYQLKRYKVDNSYEE